jgi:hypothetical protein
MVAPVRRKVTAGQVFGDWEVLETGQRMAQSPLQAQKGLQGLRAASCRCTACGHERLYTVYLLLNGKTGPCKCKSAAARRAREKPPPRQYVTEGQRYGRLVVLTAALRGNDMVTCRCDCGTEKTVRACYLRQGNSRSCGCLRKETIRRSPGPTGTAPTRSGTPGGT